MFSTKVRLHSLNKSLEILNQEFWSLILTMLTASVSKTHYVKWLFPTFLTKTKKTRSSFKLFLLPLSKCFIVANILSVGKALLEINRTAQAELNTPILRRSSNLAALETRNLEF